MSGFPNKPINNGALQRKISNIYSVILTTKAPDAPYGISQFKIYC